MVKSFLALILVLGLLGHAAAQVPGPGIQVGPLTTLPLTKSNGGTGGTTGLAAAGNLSLPYVVCQSASALPASPLAGTVTETNVATCAIPANAIGVNGSVEVSQFWLFTGTVGTKTITTRLSPSSGVITGSTFQNYVNVATNAAEECVANLYNRATNSQIARTSSLCSYANGAAAVSFAQDTTAITYINFDVAVPGLADTAQLQAYRVTIYPAGGN